MIPGYANSHNRRDVTGRVDRARPPATATLNLLLVPRTTILLGRIENHHRR